MNLDSFFLSMPVPLTETFDYHLPLYITFLSQLFHTIICLIVVSFDFQLLERLSLRENKIKDLPAVIGRGNLMKQYFNIYYVW